MTAFYKPVHFELQELVDPVTFGTYGDRAWQFLDSRLLANMDRIRNRYGREIRVNDWHLPGGKFSYRGFRPCSYKGGAPLSQHRFGRAFDFDVKGMTAEEVRADIRANPNNFDFSCITAVEMEVNWVHVDCRNALDRILWVNP